MSHHHHRLNPEFTYIHVKIKKQLRDEAFLSQYLHMIRLQFVTKKAISQALSGQMNESHVALLLCFTRCF